MPETTTIAPTPVVAPTITPGLDPNTDPQRRMHPDELCPAQKDRVVRRIERELTQ